jgi:hypothetical protein
MFDRKLKPNKIHLAGLPVTRGRAHRPGQADAPPPARLPEPVSGEYRCPRKPLLLNERVLGFLIVVRLPTGRIGKGTSLVGTFFAPDPSRRSVLAKGKRGLYAGGAACGQPAS